METSLFVMLVMLCGSGLAHEHEIPTHVEGLHEACPQGENCECQDRPCLKLGYAYCSNCRDCDPKRCCCTKSDVSDMKCNKNDNCVCALDGPCHRHGWHYCEAKRCEGCDPDKCCCQKRDEVLPVSVPCKSGKEVCECMDEPCHYMGMGYCRCPPDHCPQGNRYCCCKALVDQCTQDQPAGCVCLIKGSCDSNNMAHCDPRVCGKYCPAYRCCCRKQEVTTPATSDPCNRANCECTTNQQTCYDIKRAYCKQTCPGKKCNKKRCCCKTEVETCTGDNCECKKKGKKPCHERGLMYCPPNACGKCPAHKCCCKNSTSSEVEVQNGLGCTNDENCYCYQNQQTSCYELEAEYCRCKNCPSPYCCCRDTKIKRCRSDQKCVCKQGKKSCLQRGLAYCPPGSCDDCPDHKCCCNN